jgi:sulfhydrogenase subunit gamma (sulfur reductase)
MDHQLAFHDVIQRKHRYQRKTDIESFEHAYKAEITSVYRLTEHENLYRVRIMDDEDRRHFSFQPGQFIMLELPGIGEGPFGISSSPSNHEDIELCIRTVGNLTGVLSRAPRGTRVGLRGPFGTSFPMARMRGGNVLLIAGGLGLAPLRSPIAYVQEHRSQFDQVDIIYGTKEPSQLLFKYQYEMWKKDDLGLHIVVEQPDPTWTGAVGLITKVVEEITARRSPQFIERTHAIVCGPPIMFKFVCDLLSKKGLPMHKMFVSLERRMHCGMGKCCRCNVGSTYTCLKGPVFDFWTVMNLKEAI